MKSYFAFVLLFGVVYSATIDRFGRDIEVPVYHPRHYEFGHEIDKVVPVMSPVGLIGEKVLHYPIEHPRMIVPEMTDMRLLGCKLFYPIVYYYDDGMRIRRQAYYPRYPCCTMGGGFVAGHETDKVSASQVGVSSTAAQGSTGYIKGTSSSTSSSKESSSESNKATKIKSQSQFGAGSSNLAAQQQGALHSSSLGVTGAGVGWGGLGSGVVGINQNQQSGMYGSSLGTNSGYLTGSSNTEIEQSESNKQSASEANHASQNSYEGAGAQFAAQGQSANYQQVNRDRDAGYMGVAQPGYYRPGGYVAAGSSDRLKGSSTSLESGSVEGSAGYLKGTSSQASSEKSSSSENNKATKIKSNSNIAAGNQNLQAQQFGAAQSSSLHAVGAGYGHVGGGYIGGVGGITADKTSSMHGQSLDASSGYLAGNTNTEIEQTESNKQSQSEKNSSSNNAYEAGGSKFAAAGQKAVAQNLETEKKQASLIAF